MISNNRERWTEALRDSVAEYVALLISAGTVKQTIGQDTKALGGSCFAQVYERTVLVKNKIMLMTNPNDSRYGALQRGRGDLPNPSPEDTQVMNALVRSHNSAARGSQSRMDPSEAR